MPIPVQLSHHGPEGTDEEEFPFVEVDVVLLGGFATGALTSGAQFVGFVVYAQEVVDDCSAFPGYDAGVGILEGWHAAVLVDLEKIVAFDAVWCIAELP